MKKPRRRKNESPLPRRGEGQGDRKSTRLNSSHGYISDAGFCFKKKKKAAWSSVVSERTVGRDLPSCPFWIVGEEPPALVRMVATFLCPVRFRARHAVFGLASVR